jgi:hypothetical protein
MHSGNECDRTCDCSTFMIDTNELLYRDNKFSSGFIPTSKKASLCSISSFLTIQQKSYFFDQFSFGQTIPHGHENEMIDRQTNFRGDVTL